MWWKLVHLSKESLDFLSKCHQVSLSRCTGACKGKQAPQSRCRSSAQRLLSLLCATYGQKIGIFLGQRVSKWFVGQKRGCFSGSWGLIVASVQEKGCFSGFRGIIENDGVKVLVVYKRKKHWISSVLLCSRTWTWTKDPLINSQML